MTLVFIHQFWYIKQQYVVGLTDADIHYKTNLEATM